MHFYFVLSVTFVAVSAFIFSLFLPPGVADNVLKALSAIAAGITFVLGYLQWHLARHEASFEKFYDRMNTTVSYINLCGTEESKTTEEKIGHLRNMRVFVQLDTIEYMLGKYRLGFVEFELVDRAIRNFRTECHQEWFRDKVLIWIDEVESYHGDTDVMARYIVSSYKNHLS